MSIALESATNCWTKAQESVITALSNSARFRSIVDVADAPAALLKIFGQQLRDPDDGHSFSEDELADLSYAQVYSADEQAYRISHRGGGRLEASGNLVLYVERKVSEYNRQSQEVPLGIERWFENRVGDMLEQVYDYLDANSGPFVSALEVTAGPGTNDRRDWDTIGLKQGIELAITWGYA